MKKSIFDSIEYFQILAYIALKKSARSYEITKKFNKIKIHKRITNEEIYKLRCNFSMKLQTLKKYGLIKVIKTKSRGRYGKYSEYAIDKKNFSLYFIKNIIKNDVLTNLIQIDKNQEEIYYIITEAFTIWIPQDIFISKNGELEPIPLNAENIKSKEYTLNQIFTKMSSHFAFLGLLHNAPTSSISKKYLGALNQFLEDSESKN